MCRLLPCIRFLSSRVVGPRRPSQDSPAPDTDATIAQEYATTVVNRRHGEPRVFYAKMQDAKGIAYVALVRAQATVKIAMFTFSRNGLAYWSQRAAFSGI